MNSRRILKIARAILETVSSTVLFELKDPRVKHVTVTNVEVSPDIRSAKVYVSVMGDDKTQALTMHGLNSARGFLQAKVADRIQTRYTPILKFVLDPGVKRSIETSQALREVLPEDESAEPDQVSAEPDHHASAGPEHADFDQTDPGEMP